MASNGEALNISKTLTLSTLILCLTQTSCVTPHHSTALLAPRGIGTRMTAFGPVFTMKGRTLYNSTFDKPGKSECTSEPPTGTEGDNSRFKYTQPQGAVAHTCIEKWLPLAAEPESKPVGDWSILSRDDHRSQWAYQNHPVYLSIFDQRPTDMHAAEGRPALAAPFVAPAGIQLLSTDYGLILVDAKKAPLFVRTDKKCDARCRDEWRPVAAASGRAYGDWTPVRQADAGPQWAYRGRPLYIREDIDSISQLESPEVAGGGARLAVVYETPKPPPGFKTTPGKRGLDYLDEHGRRVYVFTCREPRWDHLSCDMPGDDSMWYESVCGGPARCADVFQLVQAGDHVQENDAWTVRKVDRSNPLKLLGPKDAGVRVWHYYGRPVFRYSGDVEPGDFYGIGLSSGSGVSWFLLPVVVNYPSSFFYFAD